MDYILQIGNYSESSEINICLCPYYLDVFNIHEIYMYLSKSCISVCISSYIASILYLIAYIIFCQRYTGVRSYLLHLIINDHYYMITSVTGRPAKCLKFRSQLSPVQADDSVSYHSQHLWLGAINP